jgi:hypothetical protein
VQALDVEVVDRFGSGAGFQAGDRELAAGAQQQHVADAEVAGLYPNGRRARGFRGVVGMGRGWALWQADTCDDPVWVTICGDDRFTSYGERDEVAFVVKREGIRDLGEPPLADGEIVGPDTVASANGFDGAEAALGGNQTACGETA